MSWNDRSTARRVVRATAVSLVAIAVVSGPLVGSVDLTRPAGGDYLVCEGGTATVEITEQPGEFTLEAGRFGAGTYTFEGEDATAEVEDVEGCPRLVYRLQVPALGVDARQVTFLSGDDEGTRVLSAPGASVEPDDVGRDAYDGTVTIELHGDDTRVLYRANVTVEVVE